MSRAVYVYRPGHPKADQWNMVDVNDLCEEPVQLAINAPIMVDRFYENTSIPAYENGKVTQVDIGSRRKHREYMKQRGLTTVDDFTETWAKAAKERENRQAGIFPDARERRNEVGRILYEVEKKNARKR